MNRRDIAKGCLALLALPATALAQTKKIEVTTLEHIPDTHDKVRWTFDTEEQALEWVQGLSVKVYQIDVIKNSPNYGYIRSGYRKVIRYIQKQEIDRCYAQIIDKDGNNVDISDCGLFSIEFAWQCLAGIRVNGKPVSRSRTRQDGGIGMSSYLSQPLNIRDAKINYIEID